MPTKIISLQAIAGALIACGLSAAPALAGPNRTWVSGHGTDSGTCTLAAPCRTFAFALTQTTAGGEIDVLDPAGYGMVVITKAISIVNDGVGVAGITAGSSLTGVRINAGASDSVHLRGLTIEGLGSGEGGISFNTGGNLAIENCVIRDFYTYGIEITPSTSSSFSVSNTIASHNGNNGILVEPTAAVVTGVLSNVITNNNGIGIGVDGGDTAGASLNVTVVDSVASNNGYGVIANTRSGVVAATSVMVRNSVASYSNTGLLAMNATLRVGHSVVTGNNFGVNVASGGTLFSYGDNDINGNTNDNTGVLTSLAMH